MSSGAAPFIRVGQTNRRIMIQVLVAVSPALAAAIWRYGIGAAVLIAASLAGAWIAEALCDRRAASDFSALVTGAIFVLVLPASSPWWLAASGSALAILFGKHLFGGLGTNLFNPVALSRAILMGLLPTWFFSPSWVVDGVSRASPLGKESGALMPTSTEWLLGDFPGAIGQAAPLAVFFGGLLMISLRTVDWRVPLAYLAAISLASLVLPPGDMVLGHAPWLAGNPLAHLLGGGVPIVAFFMLTDPVTSPFTSGGRVIFAVVAALYTMVVRLYTPYPDGAVLAVLLANATVPMIDRWVRRRGRQVCPWMSPSRSHDATRYFPSKLNEAELMQ